MPSSNRKGADAPSTAGELIDGPDKQDCSKHPGGWGRPMADYEYIWFGHHQYFWMMLKLLQNLHYQIQFLLHYQQNHQLMLLHQ